MAIAKYMILYTAYIGIISYNTVDDLLPYLPIDEAELRIEKKKTEDKLSSTSVT